MFINDKKIIVSIDDLQPSAVHKELFGKFHRKYDSVVGRITSHGYNPAHQIIIRQIKNKTEVVVGEGRRDALKKLSDKQNGSKAAPVKVECSEVALPDDDVLLLMIEDNLKTDQHYTKFSDLQVLILYKIKKNILREPVDFEEVGSLIAKQSATTKKCLDSYAHIVDKLRVKYPAIVAKYESDRTYRRHLIDLKLIEQALESNEWVLLNKFFIGDASIHEFHESLPKISKRKKSIINKKADTPKSITKLKQLLADIAGKSVTKAGREAIEKAFRDSPDFKDNLAILLGADEYRITQRNLF